MLLGPTDRIELDGQYYGRAECATQIITNGPNSAKGWAHVASYLSSGESFVFEGKEYNRVDCYARALQLGPSAYTFDAWEKLGTFLEGDQCVDVNGVRMSNLDCLVKALELNKNNVVAWGKLANLLGPEKSVTVCGEVLGMVGCLIKLLEVRWTDASAWCNLGYYAKASVTVKGVQYSKVSCFVQSLEIDPSNLSCWYYLSCAMSPTERIVVPPHTYTKRDCELRSARGCNAVLSPGGSPREGEEGSEVIVWRCVGALNGGARSSTLWSELGANMGPSDHVGICGREYSAVECLAEALEIDKRNIDAWTSAGVALRASGCAAITVVGRAYSAKECLVEALGLDPRNGQVWMHLGACMPSNDERARVGGREYDNCACFARALKADPRNCAAWYHMYTAMGADAHVSVNGRQYSKSECHSRAIKGGCATPGSGMGEAASSDVDFVLAMRDDRALFANLLSDAAESITEDQARRLIQHDVVEARDEIMRKISEAAKKEASIVCQQVILERDMQATAARRKKDDKRNAVYWSHKKETSCRRSRAIAAVCFSPDCETIFVASSELASYSAQTGTLIQRRTFPTVVLNDATLNVGTVVRHCMMAVSETGTYLATTLNMECFSSSGSCEDAAVALWKTPALAFDALLPATAVHSRITFTRDGQSLLHADGPLLHAYSVLLVAPCNPNYTLAHSNDVVAIAVTADGGYVASLDNVGRIVLWELHSGESIFVYQQSNLTGQLRDEACSLACGGSVLGLVVDGQVSLRNVDPSAVAAEKSGSRALLQQVSFRTIEPLELSIAVDAAAGVTIVCTPSLRLPQRERHRAAAAHRCQK